ncbi:hypothetical protein A3K02_02445 [candidate division WS6 bacterium RIFOXYD1_FULL_33_8]|uniref:Ribosomal RNA methyltransferase FtsJ domain-containing protein n=1 Tax=candidate division WS6 bacterium GW2011_GWC1_33_20 TaxID=1619089 RepID=A0A0F9ZI36_9BACT|nr:MAG: hypothetical protein UR32_C0013G0005 [candidate division WS6 bacterium GW2011_GWE2_33_157]KKP43789.1 MAG: hypothetical protein UR34_C0011G0043 [candidate division WS6 bacterium GW2011_GWC1_33_20]KKP56489.1 MAG: THUMP domain protein [candidate division WS6 bacterium GW2011_GWF2_33_92]OGC36043.1 MAG: hypothetical protein A2369_00900 [candidate division WS6 bacterium RIFOXYB1_FULL_33_15]OGC43182.1 MAG: hypothetical protein A3K02_02445 [candidate division WS6 bacterium RIFOXYD1_FULL_33_8]H
MEKTETKDSNIDDISFLEGVGIETNGKASAYLVTFTPYFRNVARREITDFDSSIKFERPISDSIALVTSAKPNEEFIEEMKKESPIFIKHIMPIMGAGEIEGILDKDKVSLLEAVDQIANIKTGSKFAVQCRVISGGLPYSAKDIEVYVGEAYYNKGNIPSFSDRDIINEDIDIISILVHGKTYYVGFSKSSDNLNFHSDEHRIRARAGKREISRAESKLIEALSTFKVELDGHGTALDLGAAPGGWSKVLADYGYKVLAVDPAALHPDLEQDSRIIHMKSKAQDIQLDEPLDLIVNDMNMDPQETGKIMNDIAHLLKDGGLAIVTLKLPDHAQRSIEEAVAILEKEYEVVKIRSLFHNRQEVTALLQRKTK